MTTDIHITTPTRFAEANGIRYAYTELFVTHPTRQPHSMRRDGIKRGVMTLCIGGGQGIALAL
ncbi:MAG: hypothetical protein WCZ20_00040 [Hydrogenophaga sp.]|jgi:acetyl-CoA acetyltransferase